MGIRKLWLGLGILMLLSPLGIVLPAWLGAGAAWGEWGADEVGLLVGYVPAQLERLSSIWKAPMPDYAFSGQDEAGLRGLSGSYVLSAFVGVGLVCVAAFVVGKLLRRKGESDAACVDG
jgi:cobalt/nickel transport protein